MLSDQYMAGFFDGEGSVNITVRGKHANPSLRVYIVNTDQKLLKTIRDSYGGNFYTRPQPKHKHWKDFAMLVFTGKRGIDFLKKIYPFCLIKRPQIELAMDFWKHTRLPRSVRCMQVKVPTGQIIHKLRPETWKADYEFKSKMHLLNRKGS